MAYGAVGCLELTIDRLLNSTHISIVQNASPQIIKLLYEEILSLKEALGEFDTRRSTINMQMVKTLEAEIVDVVYNFEDVIDRHLSNQFHPQSEEEESTEHPPSMLFSVDLEELQQDVDSFIQTIDKMKRAYIHELRNPSPEEEEEEEEEEEDDESNMVGLSDLFMRIKDQLNSSQSEVTTVALLGMAGIGKTTIANKLFQDPSIISCYTRLVLVTIGPKYLLEDILVDILAQVNNADDIDEIIMRMKGEKLLVKLKRMVFKSLRYLPYFIVLDDVWDEELCCKLLKLFPEDNNGSRVLLTTRLCKVAEYADPFCCVRVCLLDKKQSWDLLRKKVFGEQEAAPYELEKAGKKIAENCEGLPLTIVTVANILSKAEKTLEYWNNVADDKQHSVYKDAYDQMSNVLYPSYDYLEQHLKACFLYIGAFPQNYSVDGYDLANLWTVEGLMHPAMTSTNDAYDYVRKLYLKKVILYEGDYYIHSSFWYLCNKEAASNKLFYAVNCRTNALREENNIMCQRRLCIRNSILLAIEDVQTSIAFASRVRSLLCTGDFHDYPVPLCLEHLRLLRVLYALNIRFYEFPMEVVKLLHLRYFALTYDGNLPPSISKLLNLEYLIVGRHVRIVKPDGVMSYLPTEIWNMKELRYLRIMGRDIPHPCHEGSLLPNLLELLGVCPQSCTKYVFEKIPKLKVLGIHIYLAPDATDPVSCFDHISHLHELQKLECYTVTPILKTEVVVTPLAPPLSDFPPSLTKLILHGLGYPWEQMSKISSLPNLRVLILECYAFRGPKWEVRDHEFQKLEMLKIQDSDLEQWTFGNYCCFSAVDIVSIEHCYKLKEIPLTFGTSLRGIRLIDCNPMAVNCANKLKQDWDDKYGGGKRSLHLKVDSSWDDGDIQS